MSDAGSRRKENDLVSDAGFNPVRYFKPALPLTYRQIWTRSSAASGARLYRRLILAGL